jgi:dynein heavy chain
VTILIARHINSDIPLIESLEATKETATEIKEAVEKGKGTEVVSHTKFTATLSLLTVIIFANNLMDFGVLKVINQAREVYRIVATEASLLYFVMLQLSTVDHMYQYSLDSFTMFFLKSLKTTAADSEKKFRVEKLQSTLRWTIFKWVVRGLFEKHRLIFLTQLTLSLLQQNVLGEECGFTNEGLRFLLVMSDSLLS